MSVKVHDLSPMTELDIHTAFSSAIAGELRPPPLMRVIYRVGTHWRLPRRVLRCSGIVLETERNQTKSPVALAKSPQFVFRLVETTAIIEPHGAVLRRQGFFAQLFCKRGQSTTLFTVGHDPRLIDLSWKDDRTLLIRYPSDSAILPNFAVNRDRKVFKLSASDMPGLQQARSQNATRTEMAVVKGRRLLAKHRHYTHRPGRANKQRKLVLTPVL
jgi:hypothetical protein